MASPVHELAGHHSVMGLGRYAAKLNYPQQSAVPEQLLKQLNTTEVMILKVNHFVKNAYDHTNLNGEGGIWQV